MAVLGFHHSLQVIEETYGAALSWEAVSPDTDVVEPAILKI
jgi:hypothetical protein